MKEEMVGIHLGLDWEPKIFTLCNTEKCIHMKVQLDDPLSRSVQMPKKDFLSAIQELFQYEITILDIPLAQYLTKENNSDK